MSSNSNDTQLNITQHIAKLLEKHDCCSNEMSEHVATELVQYASIKSNYLPSNEHLKPLIIEEINNMRFIQEIYQRTDYYLQEIASSLQLSKNNIKTIKKILGQKINKLKKQLIVIELNNKDIEFCSKIVDNINEQLQKIKNQISIEPLNFNYKKALDEICHAKYLTALQIRDYEAN